MAWSAQYRSILDNDTPKYKAVHRGSKEEVVAKTVARIKEFHQVNNLAKPLPKGLSKVSCCLTLCHITPAKTAIISSEGKKLL